MKAKDDLQATRRDLENVLSLGTEVWQRQRRAVEVRHNIWEGQSDDGRKHREALGEEPTPFNGSSDTRVPLLDGIINDDVELVTLSFFRGQVQAVGVESGDAARAQNINTLLKWLRDSEMREELDTEVELAAQYMLGDDPGMVVLAVEWMRDTNLKREPVVFDDLAGMYATGAGSPAEIDWEAAEPELLGDFTDLATNPIREREFIGWLEQLMPLATMPAIRRVMSSLRKTGEAILPIPEIRENRPSITALRYMDEIFFKPGTADIQRVPLHRREWLSETELRERVLTQQYDANEVEEVIAKGRGQSIVQNSDVAATLRAAGITLGATGSAVSDRENLFEIWWSYDRRTDEIGVACVHCTVWNCAVANPLKAEPADYPDGKYPFVMRTRERLGRQVTDSRGTTVPLATHQQEVKVQRDARSNFTAMTASPPKKVKMSRGAWELIVAPNAEIPVNKMDDFDWAPPPNALPQASVEMERTTKDEASDYAGRMVTGADPNRVATKQQAKVRNFLALWSAAFRKALVLCQRYYSAADLARVTGDDRSPAALTPEGVGGKFDVLIEIDARDLNMEFAMKKFEAYSKLKTLDADGRLGTDGLVEWAAWAFDPVLARRSLRPLETARILEMKDEQNNVTKMALGIEPEMQPQGINPQYRMQIMMQTIAQSDKMAALYQADPGFQQLVQNRQKFLTQQIQQERNKVIGTLGTEPLQNVGGPAAALGAA